MSIDFLVLPYAKGESETRTKPLSIFSRGDFQRWGGGLKRIWDHLVKQMLVYRYQCMSFQRTFRHYPEGVDRCQ
jgi:hypothetical protein